MLAISVFKLFYVNLFVRNSNYTEIRDVDLLHCADHCSRRENCTSIFYLKLTKRCSILDRVIQDKASLKSSLGYKQFVKQMVASDDNEAVSSYPKALVRCPELNFDEGTASGQVAVDSHGVINYDKRRNVKSRSPSLMKNMVLSNKGLHGPDHMYLVVSIIFDTTGIFKKANWKAIKIILGTKAAFYKSKSRKRVWTCKNTCTIVPGHGAKTNTVSYIVFDEGERKKRKTLTKTESVVIVDGRWSFDIGFLLDFTKGHVHIIDTKKASIIYSCTGLPPGEALWAAVQLHGSDAHARLKSGKGIMADPKLKTMYENILQ